MRPSETFVSILCPPSKLVKWQLMVWLLREGFRPGNIEIVPHGGQCIPVDKNRWIKNAIDKGTDWLLFCEYDLEPSPLSGAVLDGQYDVTCVRYPVQNGDAAWASADAFHSGIFLTRKKVLEDMGPPWFDQQISKDGLSCVGCSCAFFRDRAIDNGYSIGWVGEAGHSPSPKTTTEMLRIKI